MANVIKHKRGSGSDPAASDLVVGEVAIRTDVGKLFTKMDNGSVSEIAGGGSDIIINTLSSSSATGGGSATFNGSAYRFTLSQPPSVSAQQLLVSINGVIQKPVAGTGQPSEGFSVSGNDIILGDAPATGADFFILTFKSLGVSEPADNSVTSAKIVDGAIVNADINASAAIAGTKISPDFGSQNIVTTGQVQLNGSYPRINLHDSNSENDYSIRNNNGQFMIHDDDRDVSILSISDAGTCNISGNLDVGAGIDVTGNITTTGDIRVPDDKSLFLGGSDDFQLLHRSADNISIIKEVGGSDLSIETNGSKAQFYDSVNNRNMAEFNVGGACLFKHGATTRLSTTSTGVDVTGAITASTSITATSNLTTNGNFTVSGTNPNIFLTDTNNDSDFRISNSNGVLEFRDTTNSVTRFQINSSGTVDVAGNLDVGAGLDVTGVTTTTGRVNIGDTQMSSNLLNVEDGTAAAIDIASHGSGGDTAYIGVKKSTGGGLTLGISNRDIIFKTGATYSNGTTFDSGTERLRIDSSGNIMFGTTSSTVYDDTSGSGVVIRGATGALDVMRNSDHPFLLNRTGNDGQMCMYHRDGVNKAASAIRSGNLCFELPSGTEKIRFQSGGGISFNGDTAAANALDDYEEGTWTPQIVATAANPSFTFLSNNPKGYYTKVGKLVTLWYDIAWSALSSQGGGTLIIQNFPYNTDSNYYHGFGMMSHTVGTTAGGYVADKHMHYANASAGFMYILTGSSTNGHMQASALNSSGHIFGGFTYRAA